MVKWSRSMSRARPSFGLMQQRTGFRPGGHRSTPNANVPIVYYAF